MITKTLMMLMQTATMTASPDDGAITTYRIELESPGGPMPFVLELRHADQDVVASIVNGPERIELRGVMAHGNEETIIPLIIPCGYADSSIQTGRWNAGIGTGVWTKRRSTGNASVPWSAQAVNDPHDRFDPVADAGDNRAFAGRWSVDFSSSDERAIGIFDVDQLHRATGTFLTTTGDYRYLEGRVDGDLMRLSCFDGAHAFLFHARMQDDGTIDGEFWSGNWWHETWTATRDASAELPDGFKEVNIVGDGDVRNLTLPDLNGTSTQLGELLGRVTIIDVFGSWCPNCADASILLHEFEQRYRDRGLKVVGIAFEVSDNPTDAAKSVTKHMQQFVGTGSPWPVLIGGNTNKAAAGEALPFIDRVKSYPTLLFVDSTGRIRATYSGYRGPATGDAHTTMRAQLEQTIKRLLDDN
ncbi:MAG: TlpA disulfide reductase family protein [Planctomycetota bacterium]